MHILCKIFLHLSHVNDIFYSSLATPQPFRSAYPNVPNGVIHLPGLSAYAGFSYRRSLIDPIHNTTPVFMQKDIVPFGQWMLEPLKFNNEELEIYPDPWNATRERSYSVIYDELQTMANEQYESTGTSIIVESERLSSRRIYLPTYIVEYKILGITYTACISGCDKSISVSGVSHKTIFSSGSTVDKAYQGASSFLSSLPQKLAPAAGGALQMFGLRPIAITQVGITIISRIAMKFHLVAPFVGVFMAYRKLFRPYMDERNATADWERQREYEATKAETYHEDSFRDTGSAKRYFTRNQKRILSTLSGEEGRQHGEESNEWYNQWEEWAKQQFEEAQRQASRAQEEWTRQQQQQQQYGQGRTYQQYEQSRQYKQQQQQQSQRHYKQAKKDDFKWDFDENDPYSVLGIERNATKDEVSKAFRRNMLKYHPDVVGQNASEKEKRKATERSKLISDAYRKIKASFKK